MKHAVRLILLLLACMLLFGCKTDRKARIAAEDSAVWTLKDRYPVTYGTLRHAYTYTKDGKSFYLSIARSKREAGSFRNPIETRDKDDRQYALCESAKKGDDTKADYTYYECLTGTFSYTLMKDESGFAIESILSMDEAIALIEDPATQIEGLTLLNDEWSAYYRLDSCNLDISLYPEDGGKHYRQLSSTYEERTEDGKTYLFNSHDNAIAYTNGTDTVVIKQTNRSGAEHVAYNTVAECRAILALLGK